MFSFLFINIGYYYFNESREKVEWNMSTYGVPCSLLPQELRICTTKGLTRFSDLLDLYEIKLDSDDSCNGDYGNINKFSVAVCYPTECVQCLGDKYFVIKDQRCFEEGSHSFVTLILVSIFVGFFGMDRITYMTALKLPTALTALKLVSVLVFCVPYIVDMCLFMLTTNNIFRNSY